MFNILKKIGVRKIKTPVLNIIVEKRSGGLRRISFNHDQNRLNYIAGKRIFGVPYGPATVKQISYTDNRITASYRYRDLDMDIVRQIEGDTITETYTFINNSLRPLSFESGTLGIQTPFNDRYEAASACLKRRCHAHIWCGGNSTYILGEPMNARGACLGLILLEGRIFHYAVDRKWNSNDRGDFALLLPAITFQKGQRHVIRWQLKKYADREEFIRSLGSTPNFAFVQADRYSITAGEPITCTIRHRHPETVEFFLGDEKQAGITGREIVGDTGKITFSIDSIGTSAAETTATNAAASAATTAEKTIKIGYGDGAITKLVLQVYRNPMEVIDRRLNFLIDRQQVTDRKSKFYGGFLLYDNETETTFVEDHCFNDRNAARERSGMITSLLARLIRGVEDRSMREKYDRAAELALAFVDREICDDRGVVYENVGYQKLPHQRKYNYAFYALLYTLAHQYTEEHCYLKKACKILREYYRLGGARFYAINIPMALIVKLLEQSTHADSGRLLAEMKSNFFSHLDFIVSRGENYPPHEVKYEQSIVAPSVDMLLQGYCISAEEKYLDEAERQLKLLEAFAFIQPDFRMNDIAIRHWDGYWFGKRKMYGDTFPHYWSCINAGVFARYAEIRKDEEYANRADNILSNNLCLIKDSRGACAYVYPYLINGMKGGFYDPWANDQDLVIYFNLTFNRALSVSSGYLNQKKQQKQTGEVK